MRVKTDRKVTLVGKNGQADGQLVDIAMDGAGIVSPRGAQIGTELELIFEIPTAEYFETLHILGTVIHRHHIEHGSYLDMSFKDLTPQESRFLREFLDYKQRLIAMGKREQHNAF